MRGEVDLIFEHPSGGKLYQSGFQAVPDVPTDLGLSLLVVATEKYQRQEAHKNVVFTLFPDEEGMDPRSSATRALIATTSTLEPCGRDYCEARRYRYSYADGENILTWLKNMKEKGEPAKSESGEDTPEHGQ